jgi:hypothetical protein
VGVIAVDGWSVVEPVGDVGVAEPGDGVLAGEGGSEEREVGGVEGTEAGDFAPAVGSGPAQGVERSDAFAFQGSGGQGRQVALVGADADLEVRHRSQTPFLMGHHRRSRRPDSSVKTRSTRNSRGLLMTVSTRRTEALS